jgi:hypothetical protein
MSKASFSAADQKTYQEFMLQGSRRGASDSCETAGTTTPLCQDDAPTTPSSTTPAQLKARRKVRSIVHAFDARLEGDWCETDSLLERLVASVANLRLRLELVDRSLAHYEAHSENATQDTNPIDKGKEAPDSMRPLKQDKASSPLPHCHLLRADLVLAKQHSIVKHETALRNLRQLLALLAQQHESLGRRLEELMHFAEAWAQEEACEREHDSEGRTILIRQVARCTLLFRTAALDLYQKQTWGQQLLGVAMDASTTEDRRVAERIADQWSRTSHQSPWRLVEEVVNS